MIKVIIFDCFGVLTTDLWLEFKQKYFAGRPELAEQATELNRKTDLGLIDYKDFVEQVAKLANVAPAETGLQIPNNVTNVYLFDYIKKQLKPKYKIGLLSNAASDWLKELFSKDQWQLFDAVALSYQTGVLKPTPQAYKIMAQKLEVELDECVFVDDREGYCVAARALGMKAVVYQNFEQTRRELEQILAG